MKRWLDCCLGPGTSFLAASADELVVALNKSTGVLSHPNMGNSKGSTLLKGSYDHWREIYTTKCGRSSNDFYETHLLHRLDQDTSGVMLVARQAEVAQTVRELFKRRMMKKVYYAAVFGLVHNRVVNGTWVDALHVRPADDGAAVRTTWSSSSREKQARTEASIVSVIPSIGVTILRLSPTTGFSHQLRLQCVRRGFPIIGDDVYGDFSRNKAFAAFLRSKTLPPSPTQAESSTQTSSQMPSLFTAKDTRRLFLHASSISCTEPEFSHLLPGNCEAPLPAPFQFVQDLAAQG